MTEQSVIIVEDIEEDISEEVEAFARLNRLGNFKEGNAFYGELLQFHGELFPVAAEHADFLLEQGSYGLLDDFVSKVLNGIDGGSISPKKNGIHISFKANEILLFRLLKALADTHTSGNLKDALEQARSVWRSLPKIEPENPSEVEIHIFEIYLQIATFASHASSWLRLEDTQPPWVDPVSEPAWEGFRKLCKSLNNQGRPWESQRIMRLLLPMLPQEQASKLCEEFMENIDISEDEDQGEVEESALIADLSTANACTRYLVSQIDNLDDSTTLSKAERWSSVAQSLWHRIHTKEPDAPKGRPFFELKLSEIEIDRLSKPNEDVGVSDTYKELGEQAREVSDLSVQAESLWTVHKLDHKGSKPDKDTFKKLRELQINSMRDSLGYVSQMDQSLQLYLRQNRDKITQISIPEEYLEASPARQDSFNAPKLVERHLENQVELSQLRNDGAATDLAKGELQQFHQSSMRSFIPLHWAVECNNILEVRGLLNALEPINEKSTNGSTALHHAVQRCHSLPITTLLLDRGADPNEARSTDGFAPLHVLVSTSYRLDAAVLKFLNVFIAHKADIHARTFENQSVVGLAACQNLATPIRRLLDLGADPNSPFYTSPPTRSDDPRHSLKSTRSALGIAAWHAHLETMKVLIDGKADVNHNDSGQTPLLEIVCSRGESKDLNRYVEGARMLLDNKADIQCSTVSGWTALGRAAYNGNLGLVKLLIDRGADHKMRVEGKSYVRVARDGGHEDIAEYLKSLGVEDS